ncbi:aminoglycoside phosphotransferase family protein [Arthrobacter sp. ISL-48]|uniref:aminoglycoside phosphotransferase family protein n=1 Tax=Arthrobacter sp. ISL-48 TaxID=2819110 RepID=UPI001BEC6851|nr:aminoglycoside phosphotransferase family protein [Arthrobacter sp. ISL-48]MBT2533277.1 aminoglycoside phosphotransferase family protein [Arthrobacter sp. ISL-48]
MHHDQVPIDLDTVRDLVQGQFPQWSTEPIVDVPADGTVNAIFRIGSDLGARFRLRAEEPDTVKSRLRAEAAAMTELSDHCPFPTPLPVAIGRPSGSYPMPWSVQTWLPGSVASPTGLAGSSEFAQDLGFLVDSLRKAGTRGRSFSGTGRGGNLVDHDHWMKLCFENSEDLLDVPRLRALWEQFKKLPAAGPHVMSHRDLTPANLLVSGGHLVGVLDGGDFGPADPSLDLVAAWHLLDREGREFLQASLGAGRVEWLRGAAWAFEQSIGLVSYYRTTNPGMSALGRNTLRRILGDPDIRAIHKAVSGSE